MEILKKIRTSKKEKLLWFCFSARKELLLYSFILQLKAKMFMGIFEVCSQNSKKDLENTEYHENIVLCRLIDFRI